MSVLFFPYSEQQFLIQISSSMNFQPTYSTPIARLSLAISVSNTAVYIACHLFGLVGKGCRIVPSYYAPLQFGIPSIPFPMYTPSLYITHQTISFPFKQTFSHTITKIQKFTHNTPTHIAIYTRVTRIQNAHYNQTPSL